MRGGGGQNAVKTALIAVSVLLIALVLFSTCFIIIEADHDCTGEDCPVCAAIRLCECALRLISGGTATWIVALAAVYTAFVLTAVGFTERETPVSQRVRMNN